MSSTRVFFSLVADTFAEARARWLLWGLFGLSTALILLFLFVLQVDLAAGAVSVVGVPSISRRVYSMQRFIAVSYSWVCVGVYIFGLFLAIFASGGLIPSILEPGRITLLLSKPIGRSILLMGRYFGNLLIVALNMVYLVGGVWLIIASKTQTWDYRFLLAIPLSIFIFAVLLAVVVLVGVWTESAAISIMVPVALTVLSALLAQHNFMMRLLDSEWSRQLWMGMYWMTPKVFDIGHGLHYWILDHEVVDWVTPVWTSGVFGFVILISALVLFKRRDY